MSEFLTRLKAFADTFENGSVEFANSPTGNQVIVMGDLAFDSVPTFKECYDVFGATRIALLAKPHFNGKWRITVASIR